MIEVLKQMVEALEWCHGGEPIGTAEAIEVGKQAIAELESQEPVAWMRPSEEGYDSAFRDHRTVISCTGGNWIDWIPLYTPPQRTEGRVCCQQYDICLEPCTSRGRHLAQRTWVGLTDEEVRQMCGSVPSMKEAVREAEAKLKELNT
jgi:hypothetical protein